MDNDDFPDIPLDNFGAETNVAAQPAEETTTAPDTQTNGSEVSQEAQPVTTEDNPIVESGTSEQAVNNGAETNAQQSAETPAEEPQQNTGRPEKQDRLQSRFDDLTGKLYQKDALIEQLQAQVTQQEAMKGIQPLQPDENGNIDPAALQDHITKTAQAQAQAQIAMLNQKSERESIANRIDREGNQIEKQFKEFLEADPVHAETVRELVSERVNDNLYNLDGLKKVSPLQIAERYFKGVESAAKKAQAQAQVQTQQNLQDLQASSAVQPTSQVQESDPNSIDSLEAKLADVKF